MASTPFITNVVMTALAGLANTEKRLACGSNSRRSSSPFGVTAELVGWDSKWVFFEHRFVRKGRVIGVVAGRAMLKAQSDVIDPQLVSTELGHRATSPELPAWVKCFNQSTELLSELIRDEERSKGFRSDVTALGQKPTYAVQKGMSALLPKASTCIANTNVR